LRISLPRAASAVLESPAQPEVDASTELELA
jgi:hypothetical protein